VSIGKDQQLLETLIEARAIISDCIMSLPAPDDFEFKVVFLMTWFIDYQLSQLINDVQPAWPIPMIVLF
jgi:hypothetical protein